MIVRAPVVVTMNGAPIIDGAVRIEGDRIVEVEEFSKLRSSDPEIIELGGCVLLPGLINAHCHLDYTCLRGKIPPPQSFTEWIRSINAEKAKLSADDYAGSINDGFAEALRFGTTSIANLTAFPELLERARAPIRTWWFAELINIRDAREPQRLVEEALRSLPKSCGGIGLAPHAPYTASPALYRRCEEAADKEDLLLTTHLAESKDEMTMFRDGAGPLFEFLRSLGRDMFDCGGATPLEQFLQIIRDPSTSLRSAQDDREGDRSARDDRGRGDAAWIIAHLNELAKSDFELLAALKKKFSIAHCPRSHAYFTHSTFAFEKLRGLGFNICLATDSLASNSDLSLFAEMRDFRRLYPAVSAEEVLQMITANAAQALRRASDLGRIAPGYLADMIALPLRGLTDVYEQIIAFDGDVPWVMIAGKIL